MLTDDADRGDYTGCEPFGPGDDYDIMNSRDYEGDPLAPDRECKPYGWGIEEFEDPALEAANVATRAKFSYDTRGMYTSAWTVPAPWYGPNRVTLWYGNFIDERREYRDFLWRVWSKWDKNLYRCSERLWDRLCDTCKTHAEAVQKYTEWADKKRPKGK